jgi:hypothetical protein
VLNAFSPLRGIAARVETRDDKQGIAPDHEEQRVWEMTQERAAYGLKHNRKLPWIGYNALDQAINRFAKSPP